MNRYVKRMIGIFAHIEVGLAGKLDQSLAVDIVGLVPYIAG